MLEAVNNKYDLEERTFNYASRVLDFCRRMEYAIENNEIRKQLARSSCSVGANYIEANESVSPKDLLHRMKIARKEIKESYFWLRLLKVDDNLEKDQALLIDETMQLRKILSTIINNLECKTEVDDDIQISVESIVE
jgi:four helix bundle protein